MCRGRSAGWPRLSARLVWHCGTGRLAGLVLVAALSSFYCAGTAADHMAGRQLSVYLAQNAVLSGVLSDTGAVQSVQFVHTVHQAEQLHCHRHTIIKQETANITLQAVFFKIHLVVKRHFTLFTYVVRIYLFRVGTMYLGKTVLKNANAVHRKLAFIIHAFLP